MAGWLDVPKVKAVLGNDIAADVDDQALGEHTTAVSSYVEDRRPDLWVPDPDDEDAPEVFTAPAHVVVAAAMLAFRCYRSRTAPETELGKADDLDAMLGIRKHRGFRFGGAA